jgi:hypothetical protein
VQLSDVQAKEAELQIRAQQLDESLKPENIERYFQLTGSTRPEELREQRRNQLSKERAGVLAQLEQLPASRARLEAAILNADALAYQQSAQLNMMSGGSSLASHRWPAKVLMAFMIILGGIALIGVIRRLYFQDAQSPAPGGSLR